VHFGARRMACLLEVWWARCRVTMGWLWRDDEPPHPCGGHGRTCGCRHQLTKVAHQGRSSRSTPLPGDVNQGSLGTVWTCDIIYLSIESEAARPHVVRDEHFAVGARLERRWPHGWRPHGGCARPDRCPLRGGSTCGRLLHRPS